MSAAFIRRIGSRGSELVAIVPGRMGSGHRATLDYTAIALVLVALAILLFSD